MGVTGAATRLTTAAATATLLALSCSHARPPANHGSYGFVSHSHPCHALPPGSPLAPLASKEIESGCLEDIQLRPGTYPDADVLFSCPSWPAPMIIVRGHGHTPYRAVTDPKDPKRVLDTGLTRPELFLNDIGLYGPREGAPPPCTTAGRGLTMSVYDYDVVDRAVDGLRKWIQKHDLDVELVIFLVPEPPMPQQPQFPPD